jgi:hypothetical protein
MEHFLSLPNDSAVVLSPEEIKTYKKISLFLPEPVAAKKLKQNKKTASSDTSGKEPPQKHKQIPPLTFQI